MRAIVPVLSSSPDLDLGRKSSFCTNMTSVFIRQRVRGVIGGVIKFE
jgi:hypothetical protein